jgi:hypothetical protein
MTRPALLAVVAVLAATSHDARLSAGDAAPVAVCFAPGTPRAEMEAVSALVGAPSGFETKAYASGRWLATATDGWGLAQGRPTTLTWAIVPDGTPTPNLAGDAKPSDLRAFLDGVYGSEAQWLPLFQRVFDRWSALTGVTYVHETADDGARLSSAYGLRGVRADVRIGGRALDGDGKVLAFNGYPDDGDMVLDTADSWFRSTGLESRRLRNVLAHEHGHGLGLDHACPIDGTKLMEPLVSLGFDGPQHDDVLGAQRLYGDPDEPNDATTKPTDLGEPENEREVSVSGVGIDDASDADLFAFTAPLGTNVDVTLRPTGRTYQLGEDSGGCGGTSLVDSRARANLRLDLLASDGAVIAVAQDAAAGAVESLVDVPLSRGAGRYFVRVRNSGEHLNQMYELELVAGRRGEKPVAVDDVDRTWEVTPVATTVLANDSGLADAPLRVRVIDRPAHGRAVADGDRVVYAPARGFVGTDSYVYEVSDVHGETATAVVSVTVDASARAGAARADADGDGWPDEFETARGTSPTDGASRPDGVLDTIPLPVTSLRLTLRRAGSSADEILLTGRAAVAEGFEPRGATVVASVAGVVGEFVLDANGRSRERASAFGGGPALRLHLMRRRGRVVAGDVRFELRLRRGDFGAAWTDEGLVADRRQDAEPRAATLLVVLDGRARLATIPLDWTATKSGTGVARLAK